MTDRQSIVPLRWVKDNRISASKLLILDQLALPLEETWITCLTFTDVARVISDMNIRGAPAIGVAAAFGCVLSLSSLSEMKDSGMNLPEEYFGVTLLGYFDKVISILADTRPTAVNLFWALDRMKKLFDRLFPEAESVYLLEKGFESESQLAVLSDFHDRFRLFEAEACAVRDEDEAFCRAMGRNGLQFIPDDASVITHCNAGALATAAYGTALGVVRAGHEAGRIKIVYCDETRPYLQGARLTAWELDRDNIPCALICDNMAGSLMARGMVSLVVVGADRIAANGDVANKIGTYQLAVLCHYHNIPFYVAAPLSTFDMTITDGSFIPIEERSTDEVVKIGDKIIAPLNVKALHPAFDVTPAKFITAIITNAGVIESPDTAKVKALVQSSEADGSSEEAC